MSKQIEKIDLNDSYLLEKKYITYAGFYPLQKTYPFIFVACFKLFAVSTWVITFIQLATMVVEIYRSRDNLPILAQTINFTMVQISFVFKLSNFVSNSKKILHVEALLRESVLNEHTFQQQNEIIIVIVDKVKFVALIYKILCVISVSFFGLFPLLDNDEQNLVALPGWFPFDVATYRLQVLAFQVATIAVSAFLNSSIDIVTSMLISLGSAQFDILKQNLLNIREDIGGAYGNCDDRILKRLRFCVTHHAALLDYIFYVENIFSYGIFLQFLASIVIICMTGFQILLVSKTSIQFVLLIFFLSCMMCQVAMYCWYGHDILIKSEGIREACYMSEWYNCGIQVRKVLFIIMERSKRPVILTAGKMFTLNLTTFASMLRSSYSYFAVLQRIYRDKEL